jgi:hypothetical protein
MEPPTEASGARQRPGLSRAEVASLSGDVFGSAPTLKHDWRLVGGVEIRYWSVGVRR